MRIIVIAAAAGLFVPTAVGAQQALEDKVVCKRQVDADTGSHFRRTTKVCMKKSEWKELEDIKNRVSREMSERGGANPDSAREPSAGQ